MQKWYAPPLATTTGVIELLTSGISPTASAMGPMGEVVYRSTQHLSADDARAIAAYLQASVTKPPARRAVRPTAQAMARGAALYGEHCAACHGDDGNGGYAPVTAANRRPYGMPPFFGKLDNNDVAAVLTFVRASWGNAGEPVSSLDIERYR
jgi:mono/diheme cytochrome c family protein